LLEIGEAFQNGFAPFGWQRIPIDFMDYDTIQRKRVIFYPRTFI
jgi:hypothetical protein